MTNRMSLRLSAADPEVAAAIDAEELRQHEGLEMIASENFVSEAVLEAAGSVFTNKALLRRLRIRGCGRKPRTRPR